MNKGTSKIVNMPPKVRKESPIGFKMERAHLALFSVVLCHSVCGTLLWQPEETNTVALTLNSFQ